MLPYLLCTFEVKAALSKETKRATMLGNAQQWITTTTPEVSSLVCIRTTIPEVSSLVAIQIFIEGDTGKKLKPF